MFSICRRRERPLVRKPQLLIGLALKRSHQSAAPTAYVRPTMPFYLHINVERAIICFISMPPSLYYLLYIGEESRPVTKQWLTNQLERTCWSTNDHEENRRTFDRSRNRTFDHRLGENFQFGWNRSFDLWLEEASKSRVFRKAKFTAIKSNLWSRRQ